MKKYLVMAAVALVSVGASAQIMTSRTSIKSENKTMWYARLGVSFDNAAGVGPIKDAMKESALDAAEYGNFYEGSIGSKTGMDIDFGFQRSIGRFGLYWGMELGVGTRGASAKVTETYREDEEVGKGSLLTWNVKYSPFTFGYKYAVTNDIKLDAHIGLFLSYDFAGSVSAKSTYNGHETEENITFGDLQDYYDFQCFDAGMQLGIGVWWKKLNLDITWQRGFVNAASYYVGGYYDYKEYGLTSSNLMIRLGYAF